MYPATRPELFKYKKLGVFVLICITAALLSMNITFFLHSRSDVCNVGYFGSLTVLGATWIIAEQFIAVSLLTVESYFVYREHYNGCATFLILQGALAIWTLLLAVKTWAWYVWLIALFDQLHVWVLSRYWQDLSKMRTEVLLAAANRAVYGPQPIVKVLCQGDGLPRTITVTTTVTSE